MIYTFYSFKGGVGRSMALAGVAHVLARRGLRVLAVDFDLEAPGLERYFFEGERCQGIRQQRGLIDLIQRYRQALADPTEFERAEFKRWRDFRLTAISVGGSLGGSVDLMTAGQREPAEKYSDYALTVRSFDWQDFFHNWKGDLFFDWLRRQWRDPSGGYDVVLVDSRTGVTEMGGVCAYQLADVAVLLCAPNYQNLEGTRDVARDFRSDAVLGLRAGRPLEILAVPARLEDSHPQREKFLDRFEAELGVEGLPMVLKAAGLDYRKLALPYLPEFAVEERLVGEPGAGAPGDRVIAVFERLADALTLLAEPDTPLFAQRDEALARLRGERLDQPVSLEADTTRSSAGNDVFLDFSWVDVELAERLKARLEEAGLRVFTLDRDAQPGSSWTDVVERALDYSQNLFVCFGAESSSRWRDELISRARRRENIRIVPVLLPGSDPAMLRAFGLSEYRWLDLRDGMNSSGLGDFIASLRQPKPDTRKAVAATASVGDPYPGARPYGEDDAAFFFGREAEIEAVLAALQTHDVVLIKGAAKVGKSSLVAAGVVPKLRENAGSEQGGLRAASVTLHDLASPEEPTFLMVQTAWHGSPHRQQEVAPWCDVEILDSIDSFPDIQGTPEVQAERMATIGQLLALASPRLKVILVGRDTLPDDLRAPVLAEWGSRIHRISLEPLQGEALRRAIEEPAKRAGHLLEPGLTERLIESAGSARSAIFQIQLALAELWPYRRRGWLTNNALNVLGHLGGVFARHLESTLAGLTDVELAGARVLFKSLASLDTALKLKAEQQPWADLALIPAVARADATRLRDCLAGAGVVDLFRGPLAGRGIEEAVQLSLVRRNPLPYFGGETVPDPAFFLWRGQFATFVQGWRASAGESALIAGPPLDEAERWLDSHRDELTEAERSLIEASLDQRRRQGAEAERRRQEEFEREQRQVAALAQAEADKARAEAAAQRARADAEVAVSAWFKRKGRQLLGALLAALVMLLFAGWAWNKARTESERAHQAQQQAHAFRLAIEGQAMNVGARPGGDFRGMQQMLVGHRLLADREIDAIVLSALQARPRLRKLILAGAPVSAVAFSPDGARLASGGQDGKLRLWDVRSGQPLGEPIAAHEGRVWSVAFNPDGARLASGGEDGKLRWWDAKGGEALGEPVAAHERVVLSIAFSPDGTRLASGGADGKLRLWDARSAEPLGEPIAAHERGVWTVAFSRDGTRLATGGVDGALQVWDAESHQRLAGPIPAHKLVVSTVAFSPDGLRLASGGWDGKLRLWDAKSSQPLGEPIAAHGGGEFDGVRSVVFSPDGARLASGGADGRLRWWDAKSGEALGEAIAAHTGRVFSLAYSPDGSRLVSGGDDGALRIWDARSDQPLGEPIAAHGDGVSSVAYSPDGTRLASGGDDGKLRWWDAKSGQPLGEPVAAHERGVSRVAYSPDGARLVSGGEDGKLRWWDAKSGQPLGEPVAAHPGGVLSVAYSPDGARLASGGEDGKLRWWDAKIGQPLGEPIAAHTAGISSVAYSPDGTRLASGGRDGKLGLWDAKSGQLLGETIAAHGGNGVSSVAYSPDGTRITSGGSDGTLRLWDARSGQPLGEPIAVDGAVWSVAYSPDGARLVSGGVGGTLRLWDARSGQPLGEAITTQAAWVSSVAFSPDGAWLASGGWGGKLLIIPNVEGWPALLCSRLNRNLSLAEWQDWVGKDIPYRRPCPELPWPEDLPPAQRQEPSTARP